MSSTIIFTLQYLALICTTSRRRNVVGSITYQSEIHIRREAGLFSTIGMLVGYLIIVELSSEAPLRVWTHSSSTLQQRLMAISGTGERSPSGPGHMITFLASSSRIFHQTNDHCFITSVRPSRSLRSKIRHNRSDGYSSPS